MITDFTPLSASSYFCEPRLISRKRHAFGDLRLYSRWQELSRLMEHDQQIVVHKIAPGYAAQKSYYRFINNDRVSIPELMYMSCQIDPSTLQGRHVLLLGDSSSINLKSHIGRIQDPENLGVLEDNKTPGFFTHAHLAVDAQSKQVVGLADVLLWCRPVGFKDSKPALTWPGRESYKWYLGAQNAVKCCAPAALRTIILDREADMQDLFDQFSQWPNTHFVIRAFRKRKVWKQNQLLSMDQCLAESSVIGDYHLDLPPLDHHSTTNGKRVRRKARRAQIEVRSCAVSLPIGSSNSKHQVNFWVVEAREVNAPPLEKNEEPILWRLITTHSAETFEQALQVIEFYCSRWIIEQLFRTLKKQGLDIEGTQLETVDAIFRQTVMAFKTASRTLQLLYARDSFESQPLDEVFDQEEQQVLEQLNQRFQGTTEKQQNPYPKDQISWAAWIIARLGGWKGLKSQRPPGPITFKWGLEKFEVYVQAYQMFKDSG